MLAPTRMRVRACVQLALVVLQVVPFLQLVPMSWAAHAPTPALGSRLATTAGPKNAERNVSIALGSNNVQGEVPHKGVVLLGVYGSLSECEDACYRYALATPLAAGAGCQTFTWHHKDFAKANYQGHCYGRTDGVWAPHAQAKIDSGCRRDVAAGPDCSRPPSPPSPSPPSPPPPPAPFSCKTDYDCSGNSGTCARGGTCVCHKGWRGARCNQVDFRPETGRVAYTSPLWTWGGSPIRDDSGLYHLFSSQITNNCGILHYCVNSQIIRLTSLNATGPYKLVDVALPPRSNAHWDNGGTHGVTIHRLPNKSYAMFYMGFAAGLTEPAFKHPNCTAGSGDATANKTFGNHNDRRIGVATSESLAGPWRRLEHPIFGPDPKAWDSLDVSNPTPIILSNGSVVFLYKGRGAKTQSVGLAFAPSIDGPYTRNGSGAAPTNLPGEDPYGWIDSTGIMHAFFHTANGAASAGAHSWSRDGIHWENDESALHDGAYTGNMRWAKDTAAPYAGKTSILARRERPQVLLDDPTGTSYGIPQYLFTSAEDCYPARGVDGGAGTPCPAAPGVIGTDKSYTVVETIVH